MKSFVTALLIFLPYATSVLFGQEIGAPPDWTNTEGKTIQAEFIRLDGAAVVVSKDGKELPIPMARLSLASRNQARDLAAKLPAHAAPADERFPTVKSFGKQQDPDHQRKLAESILAKKGKIEIWRGTGNLMVSDVKNLPAGRLELKTVDAIGTPFSDDDALLLNGCEKLIRLSLHRPSAGMLPFASLTALESLELYQSNVSLQLLASLHGHKKIKKFTLWHSTAPVGRGIIPIVASMPNLETLNLLKAGIDGDPLTPLSKLKFLRNLILGGNNCMDADLMALSALPALEHLNLGESDLADHTLEFLRELRSLRSLDLASCRLGERTLSSLAEMPSIAVLQLYNASLTDEMLQSLSGHKGLRELLIVETPITGEGFASIKPLPNLIKLHFDGGKTKMSEAGFQAIIQTCPNVSEFAISTRNLKPGMLAHLVAMRSLSTLILTGGANLDGKSIEVLSGLKLTTLRLDGSKLSDELLDGLLPLKSKLAELRLRDTRVSDTSLPTLEQFRGLTNLYISGTDITKEGAERLRKSLRACTIHH